MGRLLSQSCLSTYALVHCLLVRLAFVWHMSRTPCLVESLDSDRAGPFAAIAIAYNSHQGSLFHTLSSANRVSQSREQFTTFYQTQRSSHPAGMILYETTGGHLTDFLLLRTLTERTLVMAARYDRRLSILDGGWGAQIGPDLMFQQLEEGYDEGPDNVALICTHQSWGHLKAIVGEEPVGGCLTWTYRQLMKAARDLAIVWEGYGVERGDTIVAFLPSCVEWALGLWVAAILELTFVPLDPMSLAVNSGREQAYPLDMLRTSIVLVSNIRDAYNFDELYPDLKTSARCKIVCHEQVDFFFRGWINLQPEETYRLRASNAGDKPHRLGPEDRAVADDRVAVILFTQESSQHRPKGCPLTVHNIRTALVNQYILPQQRYLVTCPSSSSATLETVMVAWKRGAAVVFPGAVFSAQMTLSAIELHRCTRLVCASLQLEELIKDPSRSQRELDSLESLSVGGGVVRAGLLALGQHALRTRWASSFLTMAEGFGVLGWRSVSLTDRTLESVGTVMPGSMVKICPAVGRDGRVLSRGEEGQLHVGGDTIIQGYLGGALDGHFYQDSDGNKWFVTNYLATMDKNGLIRLTTQLKVRLMNFLRYFKIFFVCIIGFADTCAEF